MRTQEDKRKETGGKVKKTSRETRGDKTGSENGDEVRGNETEIRQK